MIQLNVDFIGASKIDSEISTLFSESSLKVKYHNKENEDTFDR